MAIPTYTMSMFRLPSSLCRELEQMVAWFWWGGDTSSKKLHWYGWSKLCEDKSRGGLGFRDLEAFNQALLAKQGWRILMDPNSLAARVLKDKYFQNAKFFEARLGHNPSYLWRSVLWGRDLLQAGTRWQVGSGEQISVFKDPWLPRPSTFKPVTRPMQAIQDWKVADLIDEATGGWKIERITSVFWPVDHETIFRIPVSVLRRDDKLVWHYDKQGCYSVKSGYKLAMIIKSPPTCSGPRGDSKWWSIVCNLNIPAKVKIFMWRSFHEIIPTTLNLFRRKVVTTERCPRCFGNVESTAHALLFCPFAKKVWQLSAWWERIEGRADGPFADLMIIFSTQSIKPDLEIMCMVLWCIWAERNKVIHGDGGEDPRCTLERASRLLFDFHQAQKLLFNTKLKENHDPADKSWSPPPAGKIKLNVDASVVLNLDHIGVEGVIRDHEGFVLGAFSCRITGHFEPLLAECLAARTGLQFANECGLKIDLLESDSLHTVRAITGKTSLALEGTVIDDIKTLLVNVTCHFVPRTGNNVAHTLAKYAFSVSVDCFWLEEYPQCIDSIVSAEMAFS